MVKETICFIICIGDYLPPLNIEARALKRICIHSIGATGYCSNTVLVPFICSSEWTLIHFHFSKYVCFWLNQPTLIMASIKTTLHIFVLLISTLSARAWPYCIPRYTNRPLNGFCCNGQSYTTSHGVTQASCVHACVTSPSCFATPDSKVHGANMGPTWVLSAPYVPHIGSMNLAIRDVLQSRDQYLLIGCTAAFLG